MNVALSLVDLLRQRAAIHSARRAYAFIDEQDTTSSALTFGELDRRARAIAALLQSRTRPDERVLLLHPPGLEYLAAFYGCFYAGVVAVPLFPPDRTRAQRTSARIRAITADAEASLVLTTQAVLEAGDPGIGQPREQIVASDGLPAGIPM